MLNVSSTKEEKEITSYEIKKAVPGSIQSWICLLNSAKLVPFIYLLKK
jgi:hypothetical protein